MNDDNRMTGEERRATWGLGAVFSLRMLGMFMVLPVLTTYGMALAGATETLIGIAIGIYGLTQALCQIPFGLLSDRIGRKPLIIFGLLIFTLGSIIAAVTESIWGIILGRALQGTGAIAAAVMALLSDLTREQNRTKAMALIGISFGLTFALSMVLGPIITHALGLQALFWGIAGLALLGIIITLTLVPSTPHHVRNRESAIVSGSLQQVLYNSRLLKLNFGIFSLHLLLMSSFIALPPLLERIGIPARDHWQIYLTTMLISFVCVLPLIIYAEAKHRMKQVFVSCVLVLAIAELLLWSAGQHLWGVIAGIQLFFIAFNLMEALLPSLISKESPAGHKGTAMGIYSTSQFIGVAVGGSLGGWLLGHLGINAVFLAGALLALLWLLVSRTQQEPPYVSSLRLVLPSTALQHDDLAQRLQQQPGVTEAIIAPQEQSAYVKIDTKQTHRIQLEQWLRTL